MDSNPKENQQTAPKKVLLFNVFGHKVEYDLELIDCTNILLLGLMLNGIAGVFLILASWIMLALVFQGSHLAKPSVSLHVLIWIVGSYAIIFGGIAFDMSLTAIGFLMFRENKIMGLLVLAIIIVPRLIHYF